MLRNVLYHGDSPPVSMSLTKHDAKIQKNKEITKYYLHLYRRKMAINNIVLKN